MGTETIKITAQVVGCRTLKLAGGLRVELDVLEADEVSIAHMAILANRRTMATVEFSNTVEAPQPEPKKKGRKAGGSRKDKDADR
ncbi:MAG: hypothetical protein JW724_03235 [Candidatus Altiarchaeota archaeon]|nr:hypothetical protein [Candidatus Altiarchaeota archaeon]